MAEASSQLQLLLPADLPFMHFPQNDPSQIRTKNFGEKGQIDIYKQRKIVTINGAFANEKNESLRNLTGEQCLVLGTAQHIGLGITFFLIPSVKGIYAIVADKFCR